MATLCMEIDLRHYVLVVGDEVAISLVCRRSFPILYGIAPFGGNLGATQLRAIHLKAFTQQQLRSIDSATVTTVQRFVVKARIQLPQQLSGLL